VGSPSRKYDNTFQKREDLDKRRRRSQAPRLKNGFLSPWKSSKVQMMPLNRLFGLRVLEFVELCSITEDVFSSLTKNESKVVVLMNHTIQGSIK
jgi:hypothetical protein